MLVPFILVGNLWERRGWRKAERDQFYSPFGGYNGFKQWRKANPGVDAATAANQMMRDEASASHFKDER